METFKICHIGCGAMSDRGHGPALQKYASEYTKTVLSGCCDLDKDKAEMFRDKFGFAKAFGDWKKMLAEIRPDAVSLAVPVIATAEIAVEIVESGYNLFAEKPPGMTPNECNGIINAVKKNGVFAAAAFNRRYMPMVKNLMNMIIDSPIDSIRYDFYRNGRKDADFSTTSIHGIDTVKMISKSEFSDIKISYQPVSSTPVGNIFVNGMMRSGTAVSINFYPDSGLTAERATVNTAGNTYFLNMPIWECPDYPGSILHYKNGGLVNTIYGSEDEMFITSGFYDEHRDFYEAVRNNIPVSHNISDSLQSVEIMELIRLKKTSY